MLRLRIVQRMLARTWVEWVLIVWALLGAYDLLGSQIMPDSVASKLPKVRDMISATSGFLSWQAWLLIGMAIICLACVEYVAQLKLMEARYRQSALNIVSRSGWDLANFQIALPPSAPDFGRWDGHEAFTLGEAASLWLNYEPGRLPLRADVSEVFWRLHADIYAGKLKPAANLDEAIALPQAMKNHHYPEVETVEDPVTVETGVTRAELRRYAISRNERPPFLFKDARVRKPDKS